MQIHFNMEKNGLKLCSFSFNLCNVEFSLMFIYLHPYPFLPGAIVVMIVW